MNEELNMTISPVCMKDGEKCAYISFSDGTRTAEGRIPECKIISNKGFLQEEVEQLESYMSAELATLKRIAAGIRLFDAIQK